MTSIPSSARARALSAPLCPAPTTRTRLPASDPAASRASSTATEETEAPPRPSAVRLRTRPPLVSASPKSRPVTGPAEPAARPRSSARRTCPWISASTSTIDSRPAATSKAWRETCAPRSTWTWPSSSSSETSACKRSERHAAASGGVKRGDVDLCPAAGAQRDGLLDATRGDELGHELGGSVGGQRQPFAHMQRGRVVRDADCDEIHGSNRRGRGAGPASVEVAGLRAGCRNLVQGPVGRRRRRTRGRDDDARAAVAAASRRRSPHRGPDSRPAPRHTALSLAVSCDSHSPICT